MAIDKQLVTLKKYYIESFDLMFNMNNVMIIMNNGNAFSRNEINSQNEFDIYT